MRKSWLLRALLFCAVIVFMTACCQENSDCPPDSFCVKAPGDCEGEGVCIEKSSVPCDVVKGPVCGCDGKTYGNVCEAAEAGVSVTNEGACKEVCKGNGNCEEGYYCEKSVGDCEGEGVCAEMSKECPEIYDPVCGCDGETYGNACEAGAAGVTIADEGSCEEGCKGNDTCEEGDYCIKRVGDCEGEGVCTEMPMGCPDLYDPVCGCDGKTYGNACEAGAAGVTIADEGSCEEGCKGNDTCEEGDYCIKRVGDCEGRGVCTEMPMGCPDLYDPVCGCDRQTYANDCQAAAAGVSVDYEGECKEMCEENDNCEEGYYCEKPAGDCEGEGRCQLKPEVCTVIYDPVCGCDRQTYANDCQAAAAGVSVDYEGECKEMCEENDNCEEGYYCEKPAGDCEGEGRCQLKPEVCTVEYDPVCGCDRQTYANDCQAAAAGVSVDYAGQCKDIFCPRSKGYWKNHPEAWPVDELLIGGELYTKDELLVMLKSPSKGDMDLILMKQLIPAKLNKAAGADTSSIDRVIRQADDCLESGDCSRNRLEDLKDKLDRFNNSGDDCYDDGCGDRCDDDCYDDGCGDGCDDDCDDDDEGDDDANSQRSSLLLQILQWLFN